MKNLGQMMKQAQEMQDKLSEMEVTGSSGAGMIEITLTGKSDVRTVKIDPSLFPWPWKCGEHHVGDNEVADLGFALNR